MVAMPQSKSTSLLFLVTMILLRNPRLNRTIVLLMAFLMCPLATCTLRVDGLVFERLAVLVVLCVTGIFHFTGL